MSTNPAVVGIEKKISVYIALIMAGVVAIVDLTTNGNINATQELSFGFIAFAGGRQVMKSLLKK